MASVAELRDTIRGWFRRTPKEVAPRTILIVDANTSDRQSMVRTVAGLGYQALEARTTEDALRLLEEQFPDCVILAFDLGDEDGLAALDRIREMAPETPVIMLTADWRDSRTAEAMRRGAVAYLAKPYGRDDLRELLLRH